ncbi:MAG: hypothetical protein ABFR32_10280 [Bacteroidota bacterium]
MKRRLLILLIVSLVMTSCKDKQEVIEDKQEVINDKQDIIKENITIVLKERMNNPDSFQFVSMNTNKTILVEERKKLITKENVQRVYELAGDKSEIYNQYKTEFDFLQKQNDNYKDAVYIIDFIAKVENKFGAIINKKYLAIVLNDENFTVVHFKYLPK